MIETGKKINTNFTIDIIEEGQQREVAFVIDKDGTVLGIIEKINTKAHAE